jgi:hypothetical protein
VRIPTRSVVEVSARSVLTRIQGCISEAHIGLLLFSFPQSVVGTEAAQGVRRPSKVSGLQT